MVEGQAYVIMRIQYHKDPLFPGTRIDWRIDKIQSTPVDESYILGNWQWSNDVGSIEYIFQKVNGKNVLGGRYGATAQNSYTPFADCAWSLGRDQFGRDGLTMYCEKSSYYQLFDTVTKNTTGDKLYLSNKTDKKFGEDFTLTRIIDPKK